MADIKYLLATSILFGYLAAAMASEVVDPIDPDTLVKDPSAEKAPPGQEIDPRIPHDTFTTYVNVLVDESGAAARVEVAESSGSNWLDQRAVKLALEKQYPVRTDNDEPIEYWLENEPYEVTIRAMDNRVDGPPGDPDDNRGKRDKPRH